MCILIGSVYVFEGLGGICVRFGLALELGLILFEKRVGFLVSPKYCRSWGYG